MTRETLAPLVLPAESNPSAFDLLRSNGKSRLEGRSDGRTPVISVLMPTHNQAAFLPRALESLLAQTISAWELVVINDGSSDETPRAIEPYLADPRIVYRRIHENRGLGAALNLALDRARAPLLAYLPSDDQFFPNHLASLIKTLEASPEAVLAFSGLRHWHNHSTPGVLDGSGLQLVQVAHRAGQERWLERAELVTDDLERMFWSQLRARGAAVGTGLVTCEWVDHPAQRHKVVREDLGGGLNVYRSRYQPARPLRFHSSVGNEIDEISLYRQFRERPATPRASDGLRILLVGELAYNPERVLALEERGHSLYGLWTQKPFWFQNVGPQPFGHVRDLPRRGWRAAVEELQPDVIYSLLNWQTVPFAHEVLTDNPGIPFVWHIKESPQHCMAEGSWNELVDLTLRSDGQIYSSPETREWFETVLPVTRQSAHSMILDGDLPKREWFARPRSKRLSDIDGEIHTVVPGRLMGVEPSMVGELAAQGIHVHFYGNIFQSGARPWIEDAQARAGRFLHLHPNVDQREWVTELSKYDAGWLHLFKSENGGDLRIAKWEDLNYPARIATLASAGLPLLQLRNSGARVAMQTLAQDLDIGVFFSDAEDLSAQLHEPGLLDGRRTNFWRERDRFTFDAHADELVEFFRDVIVSRASRAGRPVRRSSVTNQRGAAVAYASSTPETALPEVPVAGAPLALRTR
ncbi:MAG: glycosyltransferase family 2 protein [Chloroflexi bacterium]|nr:glycosyltransferase family 2 protein [Chloroflexota bacterium]